jgi:tetratricopeptide (TPR) repeat protein
MESPEDKVLEHAHSEPLEILADLGLVGFLLWAGALGGWFLWCLRGFSQPLDRRTGWLIAALMAGAVGVLFQNLISVNLRWTASAWTFWSVVGLAAGLASKSLQATAPLEEKRAAVPVWLVPLCGALVLFLFLPSARRYTGDWFFAMGRSAALQKRPEAEEILLRAKNLNPSFPQTYYLLAGIYYERENYRDTIAMYEKVRDLRGNVVVLVENMATAYMKMSTVLEKDYERKQAVLDAIDLYESSLARHPSFPRLADYLSRAYQRLGFVELATDYRKKAIELYEKWLDWESSYPRPQYALDLSKNYFLDKNYERSFWMLRTAVRWGIAEESIANLREALFQVDPEYRKLWEREDRKLAEQQSAD